MAVYLRMLAQWALGGFFVVSTGFKLVVPDLFAAQIGAFDALDTVHSPCRLGAYRTGALRRARSDRQPALVALLALFIPVLGYGIAIVLDISCGCLGKVDLSSLPEAILRDLLVPALRLVILAAAVH